MNIWSENNWSEFGKQINKPQDFPLPGQVGVIRELKLKTEQKLKKINQKPNLATENFNYLLNKPQSHENQIIKLREAAGGDFFEKKMEENNLNENKKRPLFELKSYECPLSLKKGKLN